jgi:hypothetical protein
VTRRQTSIRPPRRCGTAVLLFTCIIVPEREAGAQAFLPPPGEGNVAVVYQNLFARGHLDLNGERMLGPSGTDRTWAHSLMLEADFGLTDWLAVNASLPFIASRYEGTTPHLVGGSGPPQDWDDGTYHGTFQDFRVGVRVRVRARPFAVTPFVEAIIPSHHYPDIAHAAVGKNLRALVVGGSVGGFLDGLLPGMYFQAQVSHAVTEEVLGIRPNRSRVDAEVGYFVTPRFSVSVLETYQVTHHGLDLRPGAFATGMTDVVVHDHAEVQITGIYRRNHDRLQRSNFLNLGGGLGYAVSDRLQVFAAAATTVWGENVHPVRALTVGANVHFRIRAARDHEPRNGGRTREARTRLTP